MVTVPPQVMLAGRAGRIAQQMRIPFSISFEQ